MTRYALIASLVVALACSKKEEASPASAASASAAASIASAAPSVAPSEAPAEPSPVPDPIKVAGTAATPTEPNAPPAHEGHEQSAATEIHKGNYKSELEALEKEDLSADRK
jgi:hypothetical protein